MNREKKEERERRLRLQRREGAEIKRKGRREMDVGILCVIIYDDVALKAWTQREERWRETRKRTKEKTGKEKVRRENEKGREKRRQDRRWKRQETGYKEETGDKKANALKRWLTITQKSTNNSNQSSACTQFKQCFAFHFQPHIFCGAKQLRQNLMLLNNHYMLRLHRPYLN